MRGCEVKGGQTKGDEMLPLLVAIQELLSLEVEAVADQIPESKQSKRERSRLARLRPLGSCQLARLSFNTLQQLCLPLNGPQR